MDENTFINLYFDHLCSMAIANEQQRLSYSSLLTGLWNTNFTYTIPMDKNRETDGLELRYEFGSRYGLDPEEVDYILNGCNCTVLEMMVALALKCEEQIMQNPLNGNRTSYWFMAMIENLQLLFMTNNKFDRVYFEECMSRLLTRSYSPNGYGGLFKVTNPRHDMRETDIWYQCMWFLEERLEKERY